MFREQRIFWQEMNVCPYCKNQYLMGSEKSCPECRAKKTESTLLYRESHREHYNKIHNNWAKSAYLMRKEQGICVRCGKRKADRGTRCGICVNKDLQTRRTREPLKSPREERYKNGICFFCDRPVKEGYKVCEIHYQHNVDNSRKQKERRWKSEQTDSCSVQGL